MLPDRLIITPQAGQDIEDIFAYVASDSQERAAVMIQCILDQCERLCDNPHRTQFLIRGDGHKFPFRRVTVPPYEIFFPALDDSRIVRVVHIRHGARRRPRLSDLD